MAISNIKLNDESEIDASMSESFINHWESLRIDMVSDLMYMQKISAKEHLPLRCRC